MAVTFDSINIGAEYDRPFLADLWGYRGHQAIARGVFTPAESHVIVLFVTKSKQATMTQYADYIDGTVLHWQGEERHGSDRRMVEAERNGDEVHLFYRAIHHSPFVYRGTIHLLRHKLLSGQPSEFVFSLAAPRPHIPDALEDIASHKVDFLNIQETEQLAIRKSRIGQGLFRERVIKLWGGCSVTGLAELSLLRASHIKPWRECSNFERLDRFNGLLLHPALDHLFDAGWITFDPQARILISRSISLPDRRILGVESGMCLRKLPSGAEGYLEFHRTRVFLDV